MPDELSPRHLARRLWWGSLRSWPRPSSPCWLVPDSEAFAAGWSTSPGMAGDWVVLEVLSALSYVVVFRAVFCPRMSWRLSYQIAMAEQAANSVLPVSGAGGLALGVWALRRGGMSTERIARRPVGFYLLTSLANIGGVIAFAGLYAVGILDHDRNSTLTYASGAASAAATGIVLALPWLLESRGRGARLGKRSDRLAAVVRLARCSLAQGVRDAVVLLRQRSIGVLAGSFGTLAFDIAVLGVTFKTFGYSPPLGVLVLGYLIGQLGRKPAAARWDRQRRRPPDRHIRALPSAAGADNRRRAGVSRDRVVDSGAAWQCRVRAAAPQARA